MSCASSRSGRRAAERVELLLARRAGPADPRRRRLVAAAAAADDGRRYSFSLDGGDPRPDPRCAAAARGPARAVGRVRPHRVRLDRRRLDRGRARRPRHLRDCTSARSPPRGRSTRRSTGCDHLVDLGVTLVELLPLASFPGVNSWGYDGVAPWSVHEPYGGPEALQRFVDACHARGLGVRLHARAHNHAALAGEPLIDRIRDDVSDAPPIVGRGEILLAVELLSGKHVPQPEFRLQTPIRLTADAPGDKRLGVDVAPIRKARHRIDAGNPFDIGRRIDRSEQSAALQVRGDDLRDGICSVAVVLTARPEISGSRSAVAGNYPR